MASVSPVLNCHAVLVGALAPAGEAGRAVALDPTPPCRASGADVVTSSLFWGDSKSAVTC